MSTLVLGGLARRPDWTGARLWSIDAERRLSWMGPRDEADTVPRPIPGTERVVAADPYGEPFVVLANGDSLKWKSKGVPQWVRQSNVLSVKRRGASKMEQTNVGDERIMVASIERTGDGAFRRIVCVTESRLVLTCVEGASPRPLGGPIPGTERVIAATADGGPGTLVVLANGAVMHLAPGGLWFELSRLGPPRPEGQPKADGPVLVALEALRGFVVEAYQGAIRLPKAKRVQKGDRFEVTSARARELIRRGWAQPAEAAS